MSKKTLNKTNPSLNHIIKLCEENGGKVKTKSIKKTYEDYKEYAKRYRQNIIIQNEILSKMSDARILSRKK